MDPVQSGLIANYHRLGGNVTGVTVLGVELMGKRLDNLIPLQLPCFDEKFLC
jgi:hypothetical protein